MIKSIVWIWLSLIIISSSCKQKAIKNTEKGVYFENPSPSDKNCITDVEDAKKDIMKGKIVVTSPITAFGGSLRFEEELIELCRQKDLFFDYEAISDVIYEGQTQGCYGDYMDKYISEKFGSTFKSRLFNTADSIYKINSIKDTLDTWNCDIQPYLRNNEEYDGPDLTAIVPYLKIDDPYRGDLPAINIEFILSPSSKMSSFRMVWFNPVNDSNSKFESKLFSIAVKTIKSRANWCPCYLGKSKVFSKIYITVFFRNKPPSKQFMEFSTIDNPDSPFIYRP